MIIFGCFDGTFDMVIVKTAATNYFAVSGANAPITTTTWIGGDDGRWERKGGRGGIRGGGRGQNGNSKTWQNFVYDLRRC